MLLKLTKFLRRFAYLIMLIPSLFFFGFFFTGALSSLFLFSFYKYAPAASGFMEKIFTLENYVRFLSDPYYLNIMWITFRITGISTISAVITGFPIAYSLARTKSPVWRKALLSFTMISFFTGIIVRVYAWMLMLCDNGVINSVLIYLGIIREPLRLIYNEFGITVGLIHFLLPFTILSLMGPIQNVDPAIEDAARNLGASNLKTFVKITLPLSLPGIISATLLSYALGVSAFVTPQILGGKLVYMMSNLIYNRYIYTLNYPFSSALCALLLIVSLTIAYGINGVLVRQIKVE